MTKITQLLDAANRGDAEATNELYSALYFELKKMATARMSQESSGHTLQATALVSEAYLRLVGRGDKDEPVKWDNRYHFFAAASEAMRRILIEAARSKKRLKRGGNARKVEMNESMALIEPLSTDLLDLNDALVRLEKLDATKAEVVKLRFFGGLTNSEAAKVLGIGLSTAERYWAYSRAWLKDAMEGQSDDEK